MNCQSKYFIFEASMQLSGTMPRFIRYNCNVLKEIESPDGIRVHVEPWQVKTLRVFFILSGLFVSSPKYTSFPMGLLDRVDTFFLNKRICSQLLSETETTTANEMTADHWLKRQVLSINSFRGIIGGTNFIASLFQLHSFWLALTLNSLI